MAEVEIGLGAIIGDEHLAVLVGAHRARIDVQIRVELAQPHAIAARLQQGCQRRAGDAFAQRGDHAAGDEYVPRHGRSFYTQRAGPANSRPARVCAARSGRCGTRRPRCRPSPSGGTAPRPPDASLPVPQSACAQHRARARQARPRHRRRRPWNSAVRAPPRRQGSPGANSTADLVPERRRQFGAHETAAASSGRPRQAPGRPSRPRTPPPGRRHPPRRWWTGTARHAPLQPPEHAGGRPPAPAGPVPDARSTILLSSPIGSPSSAASTACGKARREADRLGPQHARRHGHHAPPRRSSAPWSVVHAHPARLGRAAADTRAQRAPPVRARRFQAAVHQRAQSAGRHVVLALQRVGVPVRPGSARPRRRRR